MPLVMGTRWGTKVTATFPFSSCSISGRCLWPSIAYAPSDSFSSLKWTPRPGDRPAPLTPDLASTITSVPARPAATAGTRARMAAVA